MNIARLEALYNRYNRREYVHPDPLEFLYRYGEIHDREVAGLVASSLAYGRVAHILKSVACVLEKMAPGPRAFLEGSSEKEVRSTFVGFKHRFADGEDVAELLIGVKRALKEYGTLNECFLAAYDECDRNILPALAGFVGNVVGESGSSHLLPSPSRGSACKRLNLYLRWMVRSDEVDPGGWSGVSASKLVIPLDTHMHRIGLATGMTDRKQGNFKTALDLTDAFLKLSPDDPVKYDFALTRLGIRQDADLDGFLKGFGNA